MPRHVSILYRFFPFVRWLRRYPKNWLSTDIFAGLTLSFLMLPQSIAFALIAGLPIEYGLYAAIIPPIIAGLYGSSSHLITGPTNAMAIVIASVLAPFIAIGYSVEVVLLLGFMVGAFQLILGMFRMGFIMDFISRSVMLGFTAGAAISIGMKQLKHALGMPIDDTGPFYQTLYNALVSIENINLYVLGITALTMLLMYVLEKKAKQLPAGLITLILITVLSFSLDLPNKGVPTVNHIQAALPTPTAPVLGINLVQEMVIPALALALLGLISSVSISRAISMHSHQVLNNNREIISQGLANISASLFHAMPVAGSFSMSNTAWALRVKSSLAAVFMGLGMVVIIQAFSTVTPYLPLASIAGMLFMTIPRMVNIKAFKETVLATREDAAVVIVTLLATLFLKLEFAVYAGILLSIFLHLAKISHPKLYAVLPPKAGKRMDPDPNDTPCPQMGILKLDGSLFFGSAEYTKNYVMLYLDNHPDMKHLLLRLDGIEVLDASGIATLREVHDKLSTRGGGLAIAGCTAAHTQILANAGFIRDVGSDYVRRSTQDGIKQLMTHFNHVKCFHCPYSHFRECKQLKKEGKVQHECSKTEK